MSGGRSAAGISGAKGDPGAKPPMWPAGIVRVTVVDSNGNELSRGTGALVYPEYVLTALHVVRKKNSDGRWGALHNGDIKCEIDGVDPTTATIVDGRLDGIYDFVWLKCPTPRGAAMIRLCDAEDDSCWQGKRWWAFGFPEVRSAGYWSSGIIRGFVPSKVGQRAVRQIQLYASDFKAPEIKMAMDGYSQNRVAEGLSGAPCFLGNHTPGDMIAMIVEQASTAAPSTLLASPISAMRRQPGWIELSPPPPELPQRYEFPSAIHSLAWSRNDALVVGLGSMVRIIELRGGRVTTTIPIENIPWVVKVLGDRNNSIAVLDGAGRITLLSAGASVDVDVQVVATSLDVSGSRFVIADKNGDILWLGSDGATERLGTTPHPRSAQIEAIAGTAAGNVWSVASRCGKRFVAYSDPGKSPGDPVDLPAGVPPVRSIIPTGAEGTQALLVGERTVAQYEGTTGSIRYLDASGRSAIQWTRTAHPFEGRHLLQAIDGTLWELDGGQGRIVRSTITWTAPADAAAALIAIAPGGAAVAVGVDKEVRVTALSCVAGRST